MYIYAEKITPRLQYIVNALFAEADVVLTASSAEFHEYAGPKINYSKKKFSDAEFLIQPSGVLFESDIKKQDISCSEWDGLKIFFQSKGDLPFDIFSASFYLLSRYEEYLPHAKDSYGRFSHEASLAFKEDFLQMPLIDLWTQRFFGLLQHIFSSYTPPQPLFRFMPTYDIDIAYAYKGKSIVRKLISKLKGEVTQINGKDTFDVYDWLEDLHARHKLSATYFFLLAKRRSKYDKNLSSNAKELHNLVKKLSSNAGIGIHPSWQSYHDEVMLQQEIKTLNRIIQKKTTVSRQHYIQFTLPYTFRKLIDAGITNDYSMGYGSINGFRSSLASSFYWYDLMKEEATTLLLHPFCYMEANSCFEQKLSAEEAAKELQYYHDTVKQVNGDLITIFHNHFLTEQPQWQPWRTMYEDFLEANFG